MAFKIHKVGISWTTSKAIW